MQEEFRADANRLDGKTNALNTIQESKAPPKVTLKRRAQSYSDFHDAVKAVLGKDVEGENQGGERVKAENQTELKPDDTNLQSELDFAAWYDELEQELLDPSQDDYTAYQKQLHLSHSHLDSLLTDTTSTLDLLATLTTSFKEVESQTTIFQRQCEGLLDEQKRMEGLASSLEHNLKYYQFLEPVTRRLNAPGAGNFVRSKEFSEMLARLDDCLDYMAAHVSLSQEVLDLLLTIIAQPPRLSYLQVALPIAHDSRTDLDPGSLCWRTPGDSFRCIQAYR